jgi:uncharacterized membrane protein YfcA
VTLGLIGGGGSILTVPILVYLFYLDPVTATAYSLFVVGFTALGGTIRSIQKKQIDFRTGVVFAIPSFIAVYFTRKILIPVIPENIFSFGDFIMTKNLAIMVFFSLIMLLSAYYMIKRGGLGFEKNPLMKYQNLSLVIQGAIVGLLTGIVGAGGGFLIIPALVLWTGLPMKKAIGTSLMIIAVKSLIGFIGDVENIVIDWGFLLIFTGISFVGIFIGLYLSNFIDGFRLKRTFGWFVLCMSVYILIKEIFL